MEKIAADLKRQLNYAVDGAKLEQVHFREEEGVVEIVLDFSDKVDVASEMEGTSLVFRFLSVCRFAASHRRVFWQYEGDAEFQEYGPDRLGAEVEKLYGSELLGWDYFNKDESSFNHWKKYLTFDIKKEDKTDGSNTIDLFAVRYGHHDEIIDLRIWFENFVIFDTDEREIAREAFIARFKGDGASIELVERNGSLLFQAASKPEPADTVMIINDQLKYRGKKVVADVSVFQTGKTVVRYGRRLRHYRGKIKRRNNFPEGLLRTVKRHYLDDREKGTGHNDFQSEMEGFDLMLGERKQWIFALHIFKNDLVDLYLSEDLSEKRINLFYYEDLQVLQGTGRFWQPEALNIVFDADLEGLAQQALLYIRAHPPRPVVVTGDPGVGKSAFIQFVAQKLMSEGWEVFEASGSDLIAGQQYIGQIEGKIKEVTMALSRGEKLLWYIPDFDKLQHQGKYKGHPISVLDQLLPLMERQEFRVIGEARADSFEKVLSQLPNLKTAVEVLRLEAMEDGTDIIPLALNWIKGERPGILWKNMDEPLLREISMLANQYMTHKKEPGRLLDLLKLCGLNAQTWSAQRPIEFKDFIQTLSTLTGLPTEILDDRKRLDIKGLEEYFRGRIVGQDEAIKVIIERIAMIKAGLTDSDKPSGVFLFVGPTGTGKTEIAKALSTFLFGSEQRLIRLDMSEFQTWDSTSRLTGEDNKLFSQIRKYPFSVVLLDEFEKAHPNIWDLFLQVFDDGRLTDDQGETADFRHSIIILTSNLGARQSTMPSIGFGRELPENTDTRSDEAFMNILMETFRPEFVNRIDRIVRFNALGRSTLRQILLNELRRVLRRRGFRQRQWAVEWEDSALDFLLEKGYTRQLGARPLKRAIEEYLLGPLAMTIVNNQFPEGDQFLFVRSDGRQLKVDFVDPDATNGHLLPDTTPAVQDKRDVASASLSVKQVVLDNSGTQAEKNALLNAFDQFLDLYDNKRLIERKEALLEKTHHWQFWEDADRYLILHEIELLDRIQAATETTASLLERLEGEEKQLNFPPKLIHRTAQRVYLLDLALRAHLLGESQDAFLRLRLPKDQLTDPASLDFLQRLDGMYRGWAKKRKMKHEIWQEHSGQIDYAFNGFGAFSILRMEGGIHIWESPADDQKKKRVRAYVEVVPQEVLAKGQDPQQMAHHLFQTVDQSRKLVTRTYRAEPSPLVKDNVRNWRTGLLQRVLEGDFDLFEPG